LSLVDEYLAAANLKLTCERRKHNHTANKPTPPKEDRPITPEQSESGAADVRRHTEYEEFM
jgi:hypothetical protein